MGSSATSSLAVGTAASSTSPAAMPFVVCCQCDQTCDWLTSQAQGLTGWSTSAAGALSSSWVVTSSRISDEVTRGASSVGSAGAVAVAWCASSPIVVVTGSDGSSS